MVTNVCVKFNYDRFRIDKVLGNWKSENNNQNEKNKNVVALGDPFRVQKLVHRCKILVGGVIKYANGAGRCMKLKNIAWSATLAVIMAAKSDCHAHRPIVISDTSGYLASLTAAETGCGTSDAPWLIEVMPGQRINVTLFDFSPPDVAIIHGQVPPIFCWHRLFTDPSSNRHISRHVAIGVGAQATSGGTTFLPEKCVWKINKMTEFYMILVRKIGKIPEFVWFFSEKLSNFPNFTRFLPQNARILHNNCPKNIFPEF